MLFGLPFSKQSFQLLPVRTLMPHAKTMHSTCCQVFLLNRGVGNAHDTLPKQVETVADMGRG
jgi:hypothetical protein